LVDGTATLTITTTATSGALAYPRRPAVGLNTAGCTGLAFVLLIGIPARGRSRQTKLGILIFLPIFILLIFIGGFVACGGGGGSGGGGNPGTTPGTYMVTVTGTSGSTTATGTVSLTVQ